MNYQESLKKVSDHIILFHQNNTDERRYYHNLPHTIRVIEAINQINAHYRLDERSYFIVCLAGWMYDLEIILEASAISELKSVQPAEEFLQNLGISNEESIEIKKCITAAHSGRIADSLLEKIVCDAVTFYYGSTAFKEYHNLLRKEIEAFTNKKIKGGEWRENTIDMLESHTFQTEYCQLLLNKVKEENLHVIIQKQEEKHWVRHPANSSHKQKKSLHDFRSHLHQSYKNEPTPIVNPANTLNKEAKFENRGTRSTRIKHHLRGVETMFKSSSSNHLRLSVMADNKAFIMISVNSILISVGIGLIIGKFVLAPKLFIPTVILLSVNVITVIYSVLATRPAIMKGKFTKQEVENKTVDLLFFGSYYKMPLEDFEFGIRHLMDDIEFLYGNLIRDIYQQGKNLGRKYRLLRISYNIFMYGMVLSVVAYIISFFF
jgi:predicted metal-dependent HD superfamily phosphohydrolase